jgi:hypothetical protein
MGNTGKAIAVFVAIGIAALPIIGLIKDDAQHRTQQAKVLAVVCAANAITEPTRDNLIALYGENTPWSQNHQDRLASWQKSKGAVANGEYVCS